MALHEWVGGLVRITIGLEDLQWIGALAKDLQISTWVMNWHIPNGWHWICGLGRDWWIGYGLVDWSGICIGVADWSKIQII